jgi:hypothetical protein
MKDKIKQLITDLEEAFGVADFVHYIGDENAKALLAIIEPKGCHLGIIKTQKGYMVETSYPDDPRLHNRLWMLEPVLLNVSYLEVTNPDLMNAKATYFYGSSPNLEMYAMPEDLEYLVQIIKELISKPNQYFIKPEATAKRAKLSHPVFRLGVGA